jgi:hypothetical protein
VYRELERQVIAPALAKNLERWMHAMQAQVRSRAVVRRVQRLRVAAAAMMGLALTGLWALLWAGAPIFP